MSNESFVQVTPDSTGKQIRNVTFTVANGDGTFSTRYMQVVSMVDENGVPVDFAGAADIQGVMLIELQRIRLGLQLLTGNDLRIDDAQSS